MSDWVEWKGGECPVKKGIGGFIRFRDGDELETDDLNGWSWWRFAQEYGADIIAYRVAEPQAHVMSYPQAQEPVDELTASRNEILRLSAELAHRTQVWEGKEWKLRGELSEARADVERLNVQLAGCGVAAMGNTREAIERNMLDKDAYGYSASYGDVLRAVTREVELREQVERLKDDYANACRLVADMHEAAVGEMRGPKRGVVEDVADLREAYERLRKEREDENSNRAASAVDSETAHAEVLASTDPSDAVQNRHAAGALLRANIACAYDSPSDHRLGLPQSDGDPVEPMSARKPYRWSAL